MPVKPSLKVCQCCNELFEHKRPKSTKTCSIECHYELLRLQSLEKYPDDSREGIDYVVCQECEYRGADIAQHARVAHGLSKNEYLEKYPDSFIICSSLRKVLSDKVKGDKNPGYQHGGTLSPYSKKFVAYSHLTEEETHEVISNIKQEMVITKEKNCTNHLSINYYLNKGYSNEDAVKALSERQSTFSLEKCIERHGEVEGFLIWNERQVKWQNTLNSKSKEEMEAINRKKSTKINYEKLWNNTLDADGYFYIIKLNDNLVKIGITSKDAIHKRYFVGVDKLYSVHFMKIGTINEAFKLEQLMKNSLKECAISKDEATMHFGWTEVFKTNFNSAMKLCEAILVETIRG